MSLVDASGIEPEVLELTPVDWKSHPILLENLLTRVYTLIGNLLSGCWIKIFEKSTSQS
tara:strand:+ start:210 stop:386 length:177 start_codon:yes stop_codon:yes gene_type:complete